MFSDEQLLRYSRQIMLSNIDIAGQEKFAQAQVLIVGGGGLGCPVTMYLAAAGVGSLSIADDDLVDWTNLQRQLGHSHQDLGKNKAQSLKETVADINADVQVKVIPERLSGESLATAVQNADVVVDCCDNFSSRFAINEACARFRKPLVSGAAIRWEGQISVFDHRQAQSPCYACLYADVHDDSALTCAESGILGPVVGIIGAMQAQETLKVLLGLEGTLDGRLLIYDGLEATWRSMNLKQDPQCPICALR